MKAKAYEHKQSTALFLLRKEDKLLLLIDFLGSMHGLRRKIDSVECNFAWHKYA